MFFEETGKTQLGCFFEIKRVFSQPWFKAAVISFANLKNHGNIFITSEPFFLLF